MNSEMVKIRRSVYEEVLRDAKLIKACEKTEGLPLDAAYANALGRCQGLAANIVIALEVCAR